MRQVLLAAMAGVLSISVLTSKGARAAEVVAFDQGNPPFMYEADGRAAGIYPALIHEAFSRIGVEVSLIAVPWKRALDGIDAGANGVGGIYKNAERLKKFDYSKELFLEVLKLYVRSGHGFAYHGVGDLTGHPVGVIRGWSYGDDFDIARTAGAFTAEDATGDGQNFTKLINGRIDCVISIRESASTVIASSGLNDQVEALPEPLSSNPAYLAFSKQANKQALLDKFDAAIQAMRDDGTFSKITQSVLSR